MRVTTQAAPMLFQGTQIWSLAPTWQLTTIYNAKVMGTISHSGFCDRCVNIQTSKMQNRDVRMTRVGEGKPRPLFEGVEVYISTVERL